jgi:putative membrane protein
MRSFVRVSLVLGLALAARAALANDPPAASPPTAEVLGKLHRSNVKEIRMGEMARDHGHSKDVQSFGKTLIKDHTEADDKVAKLAKEEKIDLSANTPEVGSTDMNMGAGFDAEFAKSMLEDHKKDIAAVESARDATKDAKLKTLLKDILPTLKKHESIAQKLVDQGGKS